MAGSKKRGGGKGRVSCMKDIAAAKLKKKGKGCLSAGSQGKRIGWAGAGCGHKHIIRIEQKKGKNLL